MLLRKGTFKISIISCFFLFLVPLEKWTTDLWIDQCNSSPKYPRQSLPLSCFFQSYFYQQTLSEELSEFDETLLSILDFWICHKLNISIKILSTNNKTWWSRTSCLISLFWLNGSPRLSFTRAEKLLVVINYIIQFVHCFENQY